MSVLYIGIDAGGTRADVAYECAGRTGRVVLPGTNARRDGVVSAARSLEACVEAVPIATDVAIEDIALFAGVAGAGDPDVCRRIADELAGRRRFRVRPAVTSDAELALFAAHGRNAGVVVVLGTGSVALARDASGDLHVRGGLGYLLGDEASGYALGRAGAGLLGRQLDAGATGRLASLVASELRVHDRHGLITRVYDEEYPLQRLAEAVLQAAEEGDADARRIIDEEARRLRDTLVSLDSCVEQSAGVIPSVLIGGLAQNDYYRRLVVDVAFPSRWRPTTGRYPDAAEAAVVLARELVVDSAAG